MNSFVPDCQTGPWHILSCICVLFNNINLFFHHLCAAGLLLIFLLSNCGAVSKGQFYEELVLPKGIRIMLPNYYS